MKYPVASNRHPHPRSMPTPHHHQRSSRFHTTSCPAALTPAAAPCSLARVFPCSTWVRVSPASVSARFTSYLRNGHARADTNSAAHKAKIERGHRATAHPQHTHRARLAGRANKSEEEGAAGERGDRRHRWQCDSMSAVALVDGVMFHRHDVASCGRTWAGRGCAER